MNDFFIYLFIYEYLDAPVPTLDSPSLVLSEKVETMDFSMPSYSGAVKGDTTSGAKEAPGIPSFNPFASSEPKEEEPAAAAAATAVSVDDSKAAEAKAAAEQSKADAKAAAEKKKADDKAADEAKKAEKEARRLEQIEKQKEAVERAKQKEADKAAAASVSTVCMISS